MLSAGGDDTQATAAAANTTIPASFLLLPSCFLCVLPPVCLSVNGEHRLLSPVATPLYESRSRCGTDALSLSLSLLTESSHSLFQSFSPSIFAFACVNPAVSLSSCLCFVLPNLVHSVPLSTHHFPPRCF